MQDEWWESPVCYLCDYWWALLIILFLALAGWFSRDYWMPVPPVPTVTVTPVPTPTPRPSATPTLSPTQTPELTSTRVQTLGTGDVQVTLLWDSVNDLDLWVTDPAGETIFYSHDRSASNGELDVDANPGCGGVTSSPVENIFWPTGDAPQGTYKVSVQYFRVCQPAAWTPFTIRLLVDGQIQTFEGAASTENELIEITTFIVQR